jgi:hypothetical protein
LTTWISGQAYICATFFKFIGNGADESWLNEYRVVEALVFITATEIGILFKTFLVTREFYKNGKLELAPDMTTKIAQQVG